MHSLRGTTLLHPLSRVFADMKIGCACIGANRRAFTVERSYAVLRIHIPVIVRAGFHLCPALFGEQTHGTQSFIASLAL